MTYVYIFPCNSSWRSVWKYWRRDRRYRPCCTEILTLNLQLKHPLIIFHQSLKLNYPSVSVFQLLSYDLSSFVIFLFINLQFHIIRCKLKPIKKKICINWRVTGVISVVDARTFIETEVEDVTGFLLIDEHIVPVGDRKRVQVEAQLLDALWRSQFARSRLQTRMQWEVSLPHLFAFERSGCITFSMSFFIWYFLPSDTNSLSNTRLLLKWYNSILLKPTKIMNKVTFARYEATASGRMIHLLRNYLGISMWPQDSFAPGNRIHRWIGF